LDDGWAVDEAAHVLGLSHTDSNQHVNSLFYPRAFEEAALRHLQRLGRSTEVLGRRVDVAFRRPSFAGEALRVLVRAHQQEGAVLCTGVFLGEGEDSVAGARVFIQLELR
jgi:acyl-CoA thioesterase FadM